MNDDEARLATQRWWLNPALAQVAFGTSTCGDLKSRNSPGSLLEHALLNAGMAGPDLDDPAQREFGDYDLQERIGEGGTGMIYRARQRALDREVAIKLLAAGHSAPEELVLDLRREARHAAQLQHPNIVVVYEIGEAMGLIYYAMQLVRGRSLSQVLNADGKFPPDRAARVLRNVAEAVDYAHCMGVLHLDLKPGNILLDEHDTPLVADFGLALSVEQAHFNQRACGTPSYMAPEQAQVGGRALTAATDVWGLGSTLYELLTGTPPFEGADVEATVRLLLEGQVRSPLRYSSVPADLEAICLRCLERCPERRYPSARALADDLGRFLEKRPVSARPLSAAHRSMRWASREPKLAVLCALLVASLLAATFALLAR